MSVGRIVALGEQLDLSQPYHTRGASTGFQADASMTCECPHLDFRTVSQIRSDSLKDLDSSTSLQQQKPDQGMRMTSEPHHKVGVSEGTLRFPSPLREVG